MKTGIYRHYKGGFYEIIGIGYNSETLEKEVIYKMLYETSDFPIGTLWIRPLKMFEENIEIDNKKTPRFTYIGNKKYENI